MYALECRSYSQIIDWAPSGLAFVIMDKKNFENTVLPEIFKEAKFSSFERKLKRWGFVKAKVNRGTKSCCYGHGMFRRGDYGLCSKICNKGDQKTQEIQFMFQCPPACSSSEEVVRTSQHAFDSNITTTGGLLTNSSRHQHSKNSPVVSISCCVDQPTHLLPPGIMPSFSLRRDPPAYANIPTRTNHMMVSSRSNDDLTSAGNTTSTSAGQGHHTTNHYTAAAAQLSDSAIDGVNRNFGGALFSSITTDGAADSTAAGNHKFRYVNKHASSLYY